MTRLDIREVSKQELIENAVLPEDETELLQRFDLKLKSYGGFVNDKPVFYAGIVDYEERKGEVWSKIVDYSKAMTAVYYIRELIDYAVNRWDYRKIIASVLKESKEMHRWIEWMGFLPVGETKIVMGKGVHIYEWRGCEW